MAGHTDGVAIHGYIDFVAGKGISGTVFSGHGTMNVIVTGGTAYVKGDAAMWTLFTHKTVFGQLFGGKWLSEPVTGMSASGLGDLTHLTFRRATQLLGKHPRTLTKGRVSTVNGQRVIAVRSSNGVTLDVATTGNPYVMRAVRHGHSTLTYSDYGNSFTIKPPRHAVNLRDLEPPTGQPPVEL
jgi:hypothetical protein